MVIARPAFMMTLTMIAVRDTGITAGCASTIHVKAWMFERDAKQHATCIVLPGEPATHDGYD